MASSYPSYSSSSSSSSSLGRHFSFNIPASISISMSTSTSTCGGYYRAPLVPLSARGSLALPRIPHALSHVSGSLSLGSSFLRLQCFNSVARRRNPNHSRSRRSLSLVRAAFLYDWMSKLCRFLVGTPIKLFAQKLEDDLDRASKMVVDGAKMVKDAADQVDELAEKVESLAEKTSAIADQVDDVALDIHKKVNDVLDVLEGEKDFTITGSTFEIVDKKDPKHPMSITIEAHEISNKEGNDDAQVPPNNNEVS